MKIMSGFIFSIFEIKCKVALREPKPCLSKNMDFKPWTKRSNLVPTRINIDWLGQAQRP